MRAVLIDPGVRDTNEGIQVREPAADPTLIHRRRMTARFLRDYEAPTEFLGTSVSWDGAQPRPPLKTTRRWAESLVESREAGLRGNA